MERPVVHGALCLGLWTLALTIPVAPAAAQRLAPAPIVLPTDRAVLPIPEPRQPHSLVLDLRNATPPPRLEVRAPRGAPNVPIVLSDDTGFGQPSTFGGPIQMPTLDRLAGEGADVGMDLGTPVADDYGIAEPYKFTGRIDKVTIDVDPLRIADQLALDHAKRECEIRKAPSD